MSRIINLIFDGASSGDKVKMRIKNVARDINYTITIGGSQIILKSSLRPEWDVDTPNALFLQGSDTVFDNDVVEIYRKNLKYFLFAIWKYNSQFTMDDAWLDKHKFKCKYCHGIKSVKYHDPENFEYCLNCKSELKICKECTKLGAEYLFGEHYFCVNCTHMNSYCQICDTEHLITRDKQFNIGSNYHGSGVYTTCCSACYTKSVDLVGELSYNYTPKEFNFLDYNFKKAQMSITKTPLNNTLYMGIEIEAQFYIQRHVNIVLRDILKLNQGKECELIYAKHDGSVPDPGSEIVTHPMTLNMFRSLTWGELFDNIIKPESFGIGGHIHVNKTAFVSPLHVYKFCKFIRTNIEYVEWIAERRLQSQWCKSFSDNGNVTKIAKNFKYNHNLDRYEMINFTSNTIELRFFWSPSSTGMLLKNVEFVDALYNYSRDTKLHFNYQEFENYIYEHSINYPYMYNFILKRGSVVRVPHIFNTNKENYPSRNKFFNDVVGLQAGDRDRDCDIENEDIENEDIEDEDIEDEDIEEEEI